MTAAERQAIRDAIDAHRRAGLSRGPTGRRSPYRNLPSVEAARQMVRWVDCPVHGVKVGLDARNRVVGRCDGCAIEAAEAQALIEGGYA